MAFHCHKSLFYHFPSVYYFMIVQCYSRAVCLSVHGQNCNAYVSTTVQRDYKSREQLSVQLFFLSITDEYLRLVLPNSN